MDLHASLILPSDTLLVPVPELPGSVRARFEGSEDDVAVTRRRARTPSRLVDSGTATFLRLFTTPKTIVEAAIEYAEQERMAAEPALEAFFPVIVELLSSNLLVAADSAQAGPLEESFRVGDLVAGCEVLRCVGLMDDTEVYQVRCGDGSVAAFKIARAAGAPLAPWLIHNEAALLGCLDGQINPVLRETGMLEGRPYLKSEWCAGIHASAAAVELRAEGAGGAAKLLKLCQSVLDAYSHLHVQGVLHADVHPRNLLVDAAGQVKIIDYGLSRALDGGGGEDGGLRPGVDFFSEPEYAAALRRQEKSPPSTSLGEQHAVAAMLYMLLTGAHSLDFSIERQEMLRQLEEEEPLPFAQRGVTGWREIEQVVLRALSKRPEDRFASITDFAAAFAAACDRDGRAAARQDHGSPERDVRLQAVLDGMLERISSEGRLFAEGLDKAPVCSVALGGAGIAYALYRIACARGDGALLAEADLWRTRVEREVGRPDAFENPSLELTPETVGRTAPLHTASGVHAVRALIDHAMGDDASLSAAVRAFVAASEGEPAQLDATLGACSTLLACSRLLDLLAEPGALLELGDDIAKRVEEKITSFGPIGIAEDLEYLGIAHGWAGILHALLRWGQISGRPLFRGMEERLRQLARCAEPAGRGVRWPVSLVRRRRESASMYFTGWCHGGAGYVHLWTLADRMLPGNGFLDLAERAAWNVWEESVGVGQLCCGLAGSAYGLLNLYQSTGAREWLARARRLAARAAERFDAAEPDWSLYRGQLGVAVLAADLAKPEGACMPFFEGEE